MECVGHQAAAGAGKISFGFALRSLPIGGFVLTVMDGAHGDVVCICITTRTNGGKNGGNREVKVKGASQFISSAIQYRPWGDAVQ